MAIDISGLPAPRAVETIAYEPLLAKLMTAIRAKLAALDIDYDVGNLETDPVKIVAEGFSYHEVLLRARVNDAVKAVLPAFAKGTDLDNVVARHGVVRASGETDVQLLERFLVSLARPSAGSLLGYRYRVLSAWPARGDVAIHGPETHGRRGDTDVILAAPQGAAVSSSILAKVQAAISASDAKPLTDVVSTRAAGIVTYQIRQRIRVSEGRDAAPVVAAALAAARAFVANRYLVGLPVKRNAIVATSYVPGVVAVDDLTAGNDVSVAVDQVAWCAPSSIDIEVAA